jgi:methylated-DNA-protein-cysteine methyltransferase-like protein
LSPFDSAASDCLHSLEIKNPTLSQRTREGWGTQASLQLESLRDGTVKRKSRRSLAAKAKQDDSGTKRLRIEQAVRAIPRGKVSTYGGVARAAGFPGAARQVAAVLRRGFGLPWQRVLGAGGAIKLTGDSALEQRFRLEAEGVRFRGRRVDMKTHEWKGSLHTRAKVPSSRKAL